VTANGARHRVVVVRHGATEWSKNGRHTGTTDLPLLPEGEEQAKHAASVLDGRPFALVLVSPLTRARVTCDLLGYGGEATIDDDLREWDYGDFEGLTTVQIRERDPGWTVWTGAIPGGETADQVARRARHVMTRARSADGDTLLVGHGHMLRVLIATWLELAPVEGCRFALDTASITELGHEHEYTTLRTFNSRG
jgi:probable phosphoglycerate mutase